MKYKVLEHPADILMEIYGETFGELIENACEGMFAQITPLDKVKDEREGMPRCILKITIKGKTNKEEILHDVLSEALYKFQGEYLLFNKFKIYGSLSGALDIYCYGEKVNGHEITAEIKAVTWHMLKVEEKKGKYRAIVLFDV